MVGKISLFSTSTAACFFTGMGDIVFDGSVGFNIAGDFFGVAVFNKIIIGFLHDQNTQTNTP